MRICFKNGASLIRRRRCWFFESVVRRAPRGESRDQLTASSSCFDAYLPSPSRRPRVCRRLNETRRLSAHAGDDLISLSVAARLLLRSAGRARRPDFSTAETRGGTTTKSSALASPAPSTSKALNDRPEPENDVRTRRRCRCGAP